MEDVGKHTEARFMEPDMHRTLYRVVCLWEMTVKNTSSVCGIRYDSHPTMTAVN